MTARRIGKSWWTDFRFGGARYRRRSPANSRAGAQAYEITLRERLGRGQAIDGADTPVPSFTFAEAAHQWLATYVAANTKPSVQQEYRSVLTVHLLPRFGDRQLRSLSTLDVERFKADQMGRSLAPQTINNHLVVLSGLFNTACDFAWIDSKPKIGWLKIPPQPFDFLSPEESRTLLAANRESAWHDMILCALRTGMRVGELLALRWQSVSLEGGVITVCRSIVRGVEGSPKNNRIRHVPMTADLCGALGRRERGETYVFGRAGRPSTMPMATRGLLTSCKRAGLRKIGWHVLRHSFASHLAALGAPIPAIQTLLGHATIQMTMRYSHLAPSTLAGVVAMLNGEGARGPNAGSAAAAIDRPLPKN